MNRFLPLSAVVLVVVAGLYAAQAAPIAARDVSSHVGQAVVVEDAVAQVSREPESGFTYINFGGAFPNHVFRVVIPESVRARIAPAVLGAERLRVHGTPRLGPRDIPEILCSDPSQLSALDAGPVGAARVVSPPPSTPPTRTCCRVCTTGKACGNSCIARSSTCRQPPGCACNGL